MRLPTLSTTVSLLNDDDDNATVATSRGVRVQWNARGLWLPVQTGSSTHSSMLRMHINTNHQT
jgi:hypothetical protein